MYIFNPVKYLGSAQPEIRSSENKYMTSPFFYFEFPLAPPRNECVRWFNVVICIPVTPLQTYINLTLQHDIRTLETKLNVEILLVLEDQCLKKCNNIHGDCCRYQQRWQWRRTSCKDLCESPWTATQTCRWSGAGYQQRPHIRWASRRRAKSRPWKWTCWWKEDGTQTWATFWQDWSPPQWRSTTMAPSTSNTLCAAPTTFPRRRSERPAMPKALRWPTPFWIRCTRIPQLQNMYGMQKWLFL